MDKAIIKIFIIISIHLHEAEEQIVRKPCYYYAKFLKSDYGLYAIGTKLKEPYPVKSLSNCISDCLSDERCYHFNYDHVSVYCLPLGNDLGNLIEYLASHTFRNVMHFYPTLIKNVGETCMVKNPCANYTHQCIETCEEPYFACKQYLKKLNGVVYLSRPWDAGSGSHFCADGDINTRCVTASLSFQWLKYDFVTTRRIHSVRIFPRTALAYRLSGVSVYIGGENESNISGNLCFAACYAETIMYTNETQMFYGRFVYLTREGRGTRDTVIDVNEIEVYEPIYK